MHNPKFLMTDWGIKAPSGTNLFVSDGATVSTFVKTKVLTEISISTLEFSVSRIVKP